MNIVRSTEKYEGWLSDRLAERSASIIQADLEYKHQLMAEDFFVFMRATFYRWIQLWFREDDFKNLNEAPTILSVGDLHTDNFGSWRDREARLVWGINDFDEAFPLPYTADLVRLVASAVLALDEGYSSVETTATISDYILAGYRSGLRQGGGPVVLAEESPWLRELITGNFKDPEQFWEKLTDLPGRTQPLPREAQYAIERMLPEAGMPFKVSERSAGVGSLGKPRYVALTRLRGANAAREAKALTSSPASLRWAQNGNGSDRIHYNDIMDRAIRSGDPYVREFDGWVVRRLSPDYVRLDLSSLDSELLGQVLNGMGWETANVHLGGRAAIKDVRKDMRDRAQGWLSSAADRMVELLADDFNEWQTYWLERSQRREAERRRTGVLSFPYV